MNSWQLKKTPEKYGLTVMKQSKRSMQPLIQICWIVKQSCQKFILNIRTSAPFSQT